MLRKIPSIMLSVTLCCGINNSLASNNEKSEIDNNNTSLAESSDDKTVQVELNDEDAALTKILHTLQNKKTLKNNSQKIYEETVKGSKFNLRVHKNTENVKINNLISSGNRALKIGHNEVAIVIFNTALQKSEQNQDALFGLATAHHLRKDFISAKTTYIKLINSYPEDHRIKHKVINNFIHTIKYTNPKNAAMILEKCYLANPNFAPVLLTLANFHIDAANYENAIKILYKAHKDNPHNIVYNYNLAVLYDRLGDFNNASLLYSSIIHNNTEELSAVFTTRKQIINRLVHITNLKY